MALTPDDIRVALEKSLGVVHVHEARPGKLFQIDMPAFAPDGDGFQVYVEPMDSGFRVSDMGATLMRASYGPELDEQQYGALMDIARGQGLEVDDGTLGAVVSREALIGGVLALLQTQASAEHAALVMRTPKRARRESLFQATIEDIITDAFGQRAVLGYHDPADKQGDYTIDAYVKGPRPLAIAIVPSDIAAERAVASKLTLLRSPSASTYATTNWVHVPLDAGSLTKRTSRRLDREYEPVVTAFDESQVEVIRERLRRAA